MVSDASKKKAAQKKAAAAAKRGGKAATAAASSKAAASDKAADKLANGIADMQISDRTCTGVLCSHPLSRDIRVSNLLLVHHHHQRAYACITNHEMENSIFS